MKRAQGLLLGVGVVVGMVLFARIGASQDMASCSTGEWPPYFSKALPGEGIGAQIVKRAFELEGVMMQAHFGPWKRAMVDAARGKYACTMLWRMSDKRKKSFYYSDPVIDADVVFFHRKETAFTWRRLEDLKDMAVGSTLGYRATELLKPIMCEGRGRLDIASTDEISLRKLALGRIDVFPCVDKVGYYLLSTRLGHDMRERITHHPKALFTDSLYLLVSRKNPNGKQLVDRFNRGLKRLRESGEYETIMQEWDCSYLLK